jgi:hypothetical protein
MRKTIYYILIAILIVMVILSLLMISVVNVGLSSEEAGNVLKKAELLRTKLITGVIISIAGGILVSLIDWLCLKLFLRENIVQLRKGLIKRGIIYILLFLGISLLTTFFLWG